MADETRVRYARTIFNKCVVATKFFAKNARRRETIRQFAHVTKLLAAVIALSANVQLIKETFGSHVTDYIEITSIMVLIFVVVVDRVFSREPPERFQDYTLYYELYMSKMESLLNTEPINVQRLDLMIELSEEMLSDCSSKWPHLIGHFETLHAVEAARNDQKSSL